jgi:hypothetical protein
MKARKISAPGPGLAWQIRNKIRPSFWLGWLAVEAAKLLTRLTGIPTITSQLEISHIRDGVRTRYGVVSRRVVTDAGVAFIVDAWSNTVELETMQYHGCGTGAVAEDVTDTALGTESTTILLVDSTRATGTPTQPTAPQLRSTATVTFDGAGAITEHGLFDQAATGGGVLFDRSVFAAINVISGDSISFEYTVTFSAGG